MADQVKIAYSATAVGNVTATQLRNAMQAVTLYTSATQDPTLCQLMGLTVASDAMSIVGKVVTRTIILNMDPDVGAPAYFVTHNQTEDGQAAIYSTSDDDLAVTGAGARTVNVTYQNAAGASHTVSVSLKGRTPVQIPLVGGAKVAKVTNIVITSTGELGANYGQISVAVFTPPTAFVVPGTEKDTYQNALGDSLGYLPPSYFSYATRSATVTPTDDNLKAIVRNLFTTTLANALATAITAADPVLI